VLGIILNCLIWKCKSCDLLILVYCFKASFNCTIVSIWYSLHALHQTLPSVLWRCWLGSRKGIRPVKKRVVGYWHGYLSGVRCRLAYMAQLMPLPLTVSCFSKIQIGFTFLVPAHQGSPGIGPLNGCVCVCTASDSITELFCVIILWKFRLRTSEHLFWCFQLFELPWVVT